MNLCLNRLWAGVLLGAGLLALACTVNPATGKRQLSLISESEEIAMGRESDEQVVHQLGLYPDEELQRYVDELGQRLAAQSERPHLPWTFRLVNDPVVNAFALPGGFIYITRGIMTHLNSEAELVGVLGHEIGHVTARHGANQMSKGLLAQVGLSVGAVLAPDAAPVVDLASQGLGLLFLKYGRDDERQADSLGVRYALRGGYDPREMADVFETLGRVSAAATGGERLPGWLSTHPSPEDRGERLAQQIASLDVDLSATKVAGEAYLGRLDGMVFGENPREGFFRDGGFYHPDLKFRLDFPSAWKTQNTRLAVAGISPGQDAVVQLTLAGEETASAAASRFFAQSGVQRGRSWRDRIGGLRAVSNLFQAETGTTDLVGLVAFIEYEDRVFGLVGYTAADDIRRYGATLEETVGSFRRLTDPDLLAVQPMRIHLVRLPRAMTLREFYQAEGPAVSAEVLALINDVALDERLEAGQRVKTVRGFNPQQKRP